MALLTLDDLKVELSTTTTDYDSLLTALASAVQSLFEEMTNRKVESATFTEYHDVTELQSRIFLKNYPVTSLTSVHNDTAWVYDDSTLIDSDDYTYDPDSGTISTLEYFQSGPRAIKVVYTGGYTSETFPAGWKEIWVRQACEWFRQAKNKDQGKLVASRPGTSGGSITKKFLANELMLDFEMLIENQRSRFCA